MKTLNELTIYGHTRNRNKIKPVFLAILYIFLCFTLTSRDISAQEKKSYQVRSSKGTLNCYENPTLKYKLFSNSKRTHEDIIKEYNARNVDPTFVGYYMDIHDQFIKAFRRSFSPERLEVLSKSEEKMAISFDLDQDGNILAMWFTLNIGTQVTPDELLMLEEKLKEQVTFKPIRKSNQKFFSVTSVKCTFKEIKEGEIPYIRKSAAYRREIGEIEEMKREEEN